MKRLNSALLEAMFCRFLQENLSPENFAVLKGVCKGRRLSSYFGFYETLDVGFSPYCDTADFFCSLSAVQMDAFYNSFKVLKEKAPPNVLAAIRQFCFS